jgi:catechol 2,3-dioxygenase-like lactoylglutathione lyase family enzyme
MSTHESLPFLENGIAQIAIVIADLDATVERYHRVFGIGGWHFYTYGKPLVPRMTYRGKPADYEALIALSYFGPTRVELIQSTKGPNVYEEFIQKHGYGVQHFGVLVQDMQVALAQAAAAGIDMIMDGAGFGADGDGHYAYLDTEERFGVVYELIERPREKVPPERVVG